MKTKTWKKRSDEKVRIEAVLLNEDNVRVAAAWCNADLIEEEDLEHPGEMQDGLNVTVSTGDVKRASLGMYVYNYAGHFGVEHSRVFETYYTPVNSEHPPPESAGESARRRGFADPWGGI